MSTQTEVHKLQLAIGDALFQLDRNGSDGAKAILRRVFDPDVVWEDRDETASP